MKRKISPDMRLMIASQQMAGMQAPNSFDLTPSETAKRVDYALSSTDMLIAKAGCEVSDEPAPSHDIQLTTDKTIMLHQNWPSTSHMLACQYAESIHQMD